ncbi:DUF1906 domain-containing protein [Tenacibaculum sp. 190524A02b]|uniref:DUF1906 domain-containing protein n=1 Tax=Tenacibaculum vairaonense TaxID=3137860 RepID=A0ABP1FAI3_9FLAO
MNTTIQQLPGKVTKAPAGLRGFDSDTIISKDTAVKFKEDGYSFCFRYLSRGKGQHDGDLSFQEANDILNSGLALSAVQHVSNPGWVPTGSLGTTYGENAAYNATSIGLPKGMNIWCDLEGIATGTTSDDVIAYCNAWYDAVYKAKYIPGIYVGANAVLDSQQLYWDLKFQHFWKSMSNVPNVANRGYQMIQSYQPNLINGIGIDEDTTQDDDKGDSVLWLVKE